MGETRMTQKRTLRQYAALFLLCLVWDNHMCSGQRRKLSPHRYDRKSGLLEARESSSSSPSPHDPSSCSVDDFHNTLAKHEIEEGLDADLVPMEYTIFNEDGSEEKGMTLVYKRPHISTYYNSTDTSMQAKKPHYSGFAIKVYNLSPQYLQLWWVNDKTTGSGVKLSLIHPYQAKGTASFPGHQFFLTPKDDPQTVLKRFSIDPTNPITVYDPVEDGMLNVGNLNANDRKQYYAQLTSLSFAKKYNEFTGIEWLAMFPKSRPTHKMWRADYFDQKHTVVTNETHYVFWPPANNLEEVDYMHKQLSDIETEQLRKCDAYRQAGHLTLNLTVISCAPRVFEIRNFLSDVEVDHILELAGVMSLSESTTGSSSGGISETKTRTSKNTWVDRQTSPIVDAIYRRAADVLRIDEALLRWRHEEEDHISKAVGTRSTISEALQLVHYDIGQQYTAHHDFGYPNPANEYQPARFATLLLYLNEGMEGGETGFPRWLNAETGKPLMAVPEKGKAVLFYSSLPDGNNDDLSHHAANPVKMGEKWLTNLWVWDPHYERME